MKKCVALFIVVSLFSAACSAVGESFFPDDTVTLETVEGGWEVVQIEGNAVEPRDKEEGSIDDIPVLYYLTKEALVSGYTGCNSIHGLLDTAEVKCGQVGFSFLSMTRMLCFDSRYEDSFFNALNKSKYMIFEGDTLASYADKSHNEGALLRFVRYEGEGEEKSRQQ